MLKVRARKLRTRGAGRARDKGKRGRSCGRFFCPRVSVSDWARLGREGGEAWGPGFARPRVPGGCWGSGLAAAPEPGASCGLSEA